MEKETRSSPTGGEGMSGGGSSASEGFPSQRELIVIAKPEAGLRATKEGVTSAVGADVAPLSGLLASEGITLQPLFGLSEERMRDRTSSLSTETGEEMPELSVFYHVEAPMSDSMTWQNPCVNWMSWRPLTSNRRANRLRLQPRKSKS